MRLRSSLLLLALAFSLLSCGPRRGGETCYDASDCPAEDGDLFACTAGTCESVQCLSTTDCPMGQVCDVDDNNYECVDGCNNDLDCLAGSTCEDGSCAEYGCRSTVLDCDWGEVCNEDSGECEEAEGSFCDACSVTSNLVDNRGTDTTCDDLILGNSGCGGDGQVCMNYFGLPTCYVSCTGQDDCPAGYQCSLITRGLPAACEDDSIEIGAACFNDCQPN